MFGSVLSFHHLSTDEKPGVSHADMELGKKIHKG